METKKALVAISLICGIFLCGCCPQTQKPIANPIDKDQANRAIVGSYSDLAIQNAIIAQHTLYPYHFVNNSADLNTIGDRDLSVLIKHFQQNPGEITVQKGSADDLLYQARGLMVYEKLLEAGIAQNKINITDGMPGGDGMPSGSVIQILEKAKDTPGSGGGMQVQF
ncbi:MAG: hypothetical protein ISS71_04905 [Phycisphaerae bacterium]|nr:hypothetical protein [Phycisphaerae bacterium]